MRRLANSPIALKRTAFQDLKRLTLLLAYGIEDSPWRARTGFVPPVPDAPSASRCGCARRGPARRWRPTSW